MTLRRVFRGIALMLMVVAITTLTGPGGVGAAEITLRAGHDQPPKSMYDEGHQYFARKLAERTNGRVQVQVFPAAQLGSEVAMIEGLRLGSIDIIVAHVANTATVVPELALFSVSYLFKDRDHFERVVNNPKFQERVSQVVEGKNLGIKVLALYSAGVRNVYERKAPVRTPEDLKGMKLRVMNNPVEAKIWKAFGAIPTPMNFGEVYSSLQAGVIDGAENSPSVVESNKHYEAAPYLIMTEHQRSLSLLMINEKRLKGLPPDIQKIVLETAREAAEFERKRDAELNAEAIERMKAKGAKVIEPDRAKFAVLIGPIQDEVARDLKMDDVLGIIRGAAK
ncbi:MAG: TRAP transporter substrate-binding protein [candidate division NC10 bacterium]|nr:TRAP transporter substrate-binding protein [candidate division NC10 bacterium]MBI2457685.1 TRAP transporter substrate-binding protein [candidate division NC10 bacterium]